MFPMSAKFLIDGIIGRILRYAIYATHQYFAVSFGNQVYRDPLQTAQDPKQNIKWIQRYKYLQIINEIAFSWKNHKANTYACIE